MGSSASRSNGTSGLARRDCSTLRQSRETTVVSQLPKFATPVASERLTRNQASWTVSSASVRELSIR